VQAQEAGLVETCLQGFSGKDFPSDPSAIQGENKQNAKTNKNGEV
jgi:hypothetical protein